MSDSSSGEAIIRDPEHLDESLRDRIRRLGQRIEMPPKPTATRSQIHITSGEVIAEIPGMSAKTRLIMNAVVIVLVLGIGVFFYGTQLITGPDGGWSRKFAVSRCRQRFRRGSADGRTGQTRRRQ